ncbi:MAG: Lipoprotein-releasing system transmembrane protein LolE [Chlamydiae bacterium]|nr:Lipoprotein-releasing system transmembrane protein LolE [Chlamydiota bacterium]
MFELSFIKKYLTPRRAQLSVSLIALLSVFVITLIVWLVVVFLSVTEGIERNWIQKLTALNAPLRLQPTSEYFSSYYYNVDRYSASSHYISKTLGQKARTLLSDPYDPEFDESLPPSVISADRNAQGKLRDPVKETVTALQELEEGFPGLAFQDIEMSGALLRLNLVRQENGGLNPAEVQSQLTSVSYLTSFPEKNPFLCELLLPPTEEDLNHLLFLANRNQDEKKKEALATHAHIEKLKTRSDLWRIPIDLLPEKIPFAAQAYEHKGQISHLLLPTEAKDFNATVERRGDCLYYKDMPLDKEIPVFSHGEMEFSVQASDETSFLIDAKLQNHPLSGKVTLEGLQVTKASFETKFEKPPSKAPLWPFFSKGNNPVLPHTEKETGILIAKNFRENGVRIGDTGYLAYSSPSISGAKEIQIPIYIAGFYDPGIMAVGNKCILVPPHVTQEVNASESAFTLEKSESNQFYVWFPNLSEVQKVKEALLQKLQQRGIEKYWKVETYQEYEFAKDLMQQFQSDKYLFTMIGILILLVACTNIISLLVLLVSDKKKEIGILRAMGAKRRSIAFIFALSGASLGLFSCLLGVFLAFITLKNIDHVVGLLSMIQGHEAFNAQFFGTSLPHEISPRALWFAAIATPLLALIAGLFPAIKAARLSPCEALRSE